LGGAIAIKRQHPPRNKHKEQEKYKNLAIKNLQLSQIKIYQLDNNYLL
jgi:hypothetical protein